LIGLKADIHTQNRDREIEKMTDAQQMIGRLTGRQTNEREKELPRYLLVCGAH